ncbi:multicopper oxidase family protein [Dickeya poaceiphila]|uniref:Multicopper oxidase family protein n=1 Tax=Dickeya poaceiphila TaxID=568768 RepID=A0A5B8I8V0_9GAMM|nr:multicopper oxidase family protein [Dickeya poaceiphila]QDX29420.1 multicopper oxidase family protein [Dickeya poaceiphila]
MTSRFFFIFLLTSLVFDSRADGVSIENENTLNENEEAGFLFENPPHLQRLVKPLLQNHFSGIQEENREKYYELDVGYVEGRIYDPSQNRFQKVHLRGYTGSTDRLPVIGAPFVAPQIDVMPGDTVRILLKNNLPVDSSCQLHQMGSGNASSMLMHSHSTMAQPASGASLSSSALSNSPHCFNGTNLHAHGIWISPTGNSDNVLLSVNPGNSFEYQYNFSQDIPAGTFWYHSHRHGSTALQVSSGMAGALIVHGDRKPTASSNGDLDTLLIDPDSRQPFPEHTVLFQQIEYACLGRDGKLKRDQKGNINWDCRPNETGVIEDYAQFGPGTWQASGRWTSINGVVLPTFKATTGQVERWRLIHGGVRETINVEFRKIKAGMNLNELHRKTHFGKLRRQDVDALINELCSGEKIPFQVVAADGLTMSHSLTAEKVTLQPGYRYDLLTMFPQAGGYCMIQPAQSRTGSISGKAQGNSLLGLVSVSGTDNIAVQDFVPTLRRKLTYSAQKLMPEEVRQNIVDELNRSDNQIYLTRFAPHTRDVSDEEIAGQPKQKIVFFAGGTQPNKANIFAIGHDFGVEKVNGVWLPKQLNAYDPKRIDMTLPLWASQEWELRSYSVSHPFHIHVNPFQIVAIYDPQGRDVSLPGATEADGDSQFAGLKGQWKDTIFVKTNLLPGQLTGKPQNYYRVLLRTRYQRYIGEFVLHCHILDHEDQGMMENVEIVLSQEQKAAHRQ